MKEKIIKKILIVVLFLLLIIFSVLIYFMTSSLLENKLLNLAILFIFIILVFLLGGAILKMIRDYTIGKKVFDDFKTKEIIYDNEIVLSFLKKMPYYQYLIPIPDGVILVNGSGISVIKLFKGEGTLTIKNNKCLFNDQPIDNLFSYKSDTNYLIKSATIIYNVEDINVVNLAELIFKIEKSLIVPKYTEKEVDELFKKVKYGHN